MKYFVYVSATKLDMLHSQIAEEGERELSFGFDFKILKALKKIKRTTDGNLYNRLNTVVSRLERLGKVGGIADDKPYIKASLPMKMCGYGYNYSGDQSPIVFWGAGLDQFGADQQSVSKTIYTMAGSTHHLLGASIESRAHSHSLTEPMTSWFLENLGDRFPKPKQSLISNIDNPRRFSLDEYDIANGAYLAATQMGGEIKNYEFLARVLHRSNWPNGFRNEAVSRIILASPLYVCEVD